MYHRRTISALRSLDIIRLFALRYSVVSTSYRLASGPSFVKPISSPMTPFGFGTGHSRLVLSACGFSAASLMSSNCTMPSLLSAFCGRLLRRRFPVVSSTSPSANLTLGAGQGRIWGTETTKKLTKSVVAKREEVVRDLGCRCGGMTEQRGFSLATCRLVSCRERVCLGCPLT